MTTAIENARLKIMGITQDVTDCECCGRTGLKKTVIMGIMDADGNVGDVVHYGSACAQRRFMHLTTNSIEKIAAKRQADAKAEEDKRAYWENQARRAANCKATGVWA